MTLSASLPAQSWVYDPSRDLLYIAGTDGVLKAWSISQKTFVFELNLGVKPAGMDISADGQWLVVGNAERITTSGQFAFQPTYEDQLARVNLSTRGVDVIHLALTDRYENGVSDVAIGANGKVLFSTAFDGSGWNTFREFSVADAQPAFTTVSGLGSIRQSSYLTASPDHRFILIQEANISDGAFELYDSASGRVVAENDLYNVGFSGFNSTGGDISSTGMVVDILYNNVFLFDAQLRPLANLSTYTSTGAVIGGQFSPDSHLLYLWQGAAKKILIIDTQTFAKVGEFAVAAVAGTGFVGAPYGDMEFIHNGQVLVLDTGTGVELVDLSAPSEGPVVGKNLVGSAGPDTLLGGAGDDTLTGGAGANMLRGADGNDLIFGGADFDDTHGNVGDDTVHGGGFDDWVVGGQGNDVLFGDDGGDLCYGNLGADTIDGGAGDDGVVGGQANDILNGGAGNDFLTGDRGDDTLTGGLGADTFRTFNQTGVDRVMDFNPGQGDHVQVDAGSAYLLRQVGSDTVIDFGGGNQMVLVGIQLSSLAPGWIVGG